jgi:hypothetical protein
VSWAIEQEAASLGLQHIGRLTSNLLRPVPIAPLRVEVRVDYAGRNAAHLAAELIAGDKVVARFTALAQREAPIELPVDVLDHPRGQAPRGEPRLFSALLSPRFGWGISILLKSVSPVVSFSTDLVSSGFGWPNL